MHPLLLNLGKRLAPRFVQRIVRLRRMKAYWRLEIDRLGEVELVELSRLFGSGQLALDVGANIGTYAYALTQLGGRVVALEPVPALAERLRMLALHSVEVRQLAASNLDGEAVLAVPPINGLATLRTDSEFFDQVGHVTVKTARIDSLLLDKLSLIKIDVEGFEEEVIDGAIATVQRDRPNLLVEIEERHNPGGLGRILARMAAMGYNCCFYRLDRWRSIDEFDHLQHQSDANANAMLGARSRRAIDYVNNFLFVPRESQLTLERLNG